MTDERQKEIDRLKELLKIRKQEYAIFGVTAEDIRKDGEIIEQILKLSNPPLTQI